MTLDDVLEKNRLEETKTVLSVVTSRMVIPLYFVFWLCDVIYIPELQWTFLGLRALVIPIALFVYFALAYTNTFYKAQVLALSYMVGLAIIINIMIYMIGDATTPYYAGLNLIAVGGLSFIPFTIPFFILATVGVFGPYYLIVLSHASAHVDLSQIAIISFFIFGTIIITLVVRLFREHLRVKELTIRSKLANEIELRKTAENDLVEARDIALSASEAKSTFLANMSHELRTPLNAIIGFSQLVKDECRDDGNEQYINDLDKIDSSAKHLLNMICSVLDISKIESGRMDIFNTSFNLDSLITETKDLVSPLVMKNGNKLEVKCPDNIGKITTDEMKLRQILLNLLSNACKFTENGCIRLEVETLTSNNRTWLKFMVSDTGIGMTPRQSVKVFQPFVQAESSTSNKYGGTGLGLSICQRFCKLMGGYITVNSEVNIGTTFTMYLPQQDSQQPTRSNDNDRRKTTKQVLILQNHCSSLKNFLEVSLLNSGFQPISCPLDNELSEIIHELKPDMLLIPSDISHANDETLSYLQEQVSVNDLPFIVASVDTSKHSGYAIGFSKSLIEDTKKNNISQKTLIINSKNQEKNNSKMHRTSTVREAINLLTHEHYGQVILDINLTDLKQYNDVPQLLNVVNDKKIKFSFNNNVAELPLNTVECLQKIHDSLNQTHLQEQNFISMLTNLLINFARNPDQDETTIDTPPLR